VARPAASCDNALMFCFSASVRLLFFVILSFQKHRSSPFFEILGMCLIGDDIAFKAEVKG
jgi:hypothetical protein